MATHRVPILGFATAPDASGNVWVEPLDVAATNDVWKHLVWKFSNSGSARIGLRGLFVVPKNYVAGSALVLHWSSTATSGNVVWDFDYRSVAGDDSASLDQTTNTQSVTGTDAAPGAAWRRLQLSISLTAGNFAADSTVQFELFRDKSDAADTMAASAYLFGLFFEYTD